MNELTVRCGCGREMAIAARHGRGAYRCGCGTLVTIISEAKPPPKWYGCVVERDGERCYDQVGITQPFRLCDFHLDATGYRKYLSWKWMKAPELAEHFAEAQSRNLREQIARDEKSTGYKRVPQEGTIRVDARPIVYFIQSGEYVKIGATVDLIKRLQSITVPQEPVVLLTLDGYKVREKGFHHRFKHLRCNREWFYLKDDLLDFINAERAIHGLPAAHPDA